MVVTITISVLSCSLSRVPAEPTATPEPSLTPSPSPVPFTRYGETLIDVTYCTMDALPQRMDVYFPESGGPWPVVVYVHGGGWTRGDKSDTAEFAGGMAARGYLVASINYRLYPEARYPAMIQDVKCAIRSLRANAGAYNLDPNRIAAAGASAGGHLVSLLGTSDPNNEWDVGEHLEQSSRVQAVVAIAPVTDMTRSFPNADLELIMQVGFGEDNIVQASPITHVTAEDPPFLLIHGNLDELVPYEQSQLMYDRLVQMHVPAQLLTVQNGYHSLTAPDGSATPTLDEINQIILDFLSKYV